MEIIQKIVDLLKEHDVRVNSTQEQNGEYVTECEFWSDAGEDMIVNIWHGESAKSFVDGWKNYSYDFDPDEHAEGWVSQRGKNGVPNSIRELLDDADAIAKKLEDTADALAKLSLLPTAQEIYDVLNEMWKHFYPDAEDFENPEMNKDNACFAGMSLAADMSHIFKEFGHDNEEVDTYIRQCLSRFDGYDLKSIYIDVDRLKREAEIRSDWAAAFRGVKDGSDLSHDIMYGLSDADISALAKLHKRNRFRKKIEDLLEDCNFHSVYGDFSGGNYDKYIK